LGQFRRADVANDNEPVFLDDLCAFLVQGIFSPVGNLCVEVANALRRLSRPLHCGEFGFALAIELRDRNLSLVRPGRQRLETEVYADAGVRCPVGALQFDWNVDVPTATGILVEATGSDLDARLKDVAQVHRLVANAAKRKGLAIEIDVPGVERYPT